MKVRTHSFLLPLLLILTFVCIRPITGAALTPEQVLVVENEDAGYSHNLAGYYLKKRNIPPANLIRIKAPGGEDCSREDYEKYIAAPIKTFLKNNDPGGEKFRCLVLMSGIPLRVGPPKLNPEESRELLNLKKKLDSIRDQIKQAEQQKDNPELNTLRKAAEDVNKQIDRAGKVFQGAAVDSELALVREDSYPLDGWLPNKYFLGYRGKNIRNMPEKAILVSRLDGPTEDIVRRMIDDSLHAEKEGLSGRAYFDTRWPDPGTKADLTAFKDGYAFYDRAIHYAARLVEKSGRMPVTIDSKDSLFQPGQCPNAALYCGWYSLGQYVDAFTWVRGAVGFHIASSECQTLKNKESQVWCKRMLEKGVAATLGPVAEPYVQAFPLPDVFFGLLLDGQLSLAECYALSNPFWSWRMVLIGDPLYRPFKK